METKFDTYNSINAQIAETTLAIKNIQAWPHKNASDMRELSAEKKKLESLNLKKLECLREIVIAAQAEELFITNNIVCHDAILQSNAPSC